MRAAISIGVRKVGNQLPLLDGAVADARRFASWARAHDYDHVRVIHDTHRPVTLNAVKAAILRVLRTCPERLLIYFSGHGASLPSGDFWLLSNADTDPDEAVNLTLSFNCAKRHRIGQLAIFADACRSSATPFLGGGSIFPFAAVASERPPKWDQFLSTRLGDVAQEIAETNAATSYGIFSRCLFSAFSGRAPDAIEWRGREAVICSAGLANWLEEAVPFETGKIPGASVQFPDTNSGWRRPDDVYVTLRATELDGDGYDEYDFSPFRSFMSEDYLDDAVRLESLQHPDWYTWTQKGRKRVEAARKLLEGRSEQRKRQARAAMPVRARLREGLTIRGARILEAVARPGVTATVSASGHGQRVRCDGDGPQPIALKMAGGDWFPTLLLPGYTSTALFLDGAVAAFGYRETGADAPPLSPQMQTLWGILMSDRQPDPEQLKTFANDVRRHKHVNPALGVLAAHAYERAGLLNQIDSMIRYFAAREEPVPYDIAILSRFALRLEEGQPAFSSSARKRLRAPKAAIAGSFPLLGRGWAMLHPENPGVHPKLLEIKNGLRPSTWSLLQPHEGRILAEYLYNGDL